MQALTSTYEYAVSHSDAMTYSRDDDVKNAANQIGGGALLLPRYSKLDGQYANADWINGYVSAQISDGDGLFPEDSLPAVKAAFAREKSCSGLRIRFNSHSGDYPAGIKVRWTRLNGDLISEETIKPGGPDLYLYRDVAGFAVVEASFFSTSKPYRPVFVEYIGFLNLRVYDGFRIVYAGTAPGAIDTAVFSADSPRTESTMGTLKTGEANRAALCLPDYAKLDGNYINYVSGANMGYVSSQISGEDGSFETAPELYCDLTSSGDKYISTGIHIIFNEVSGDYCNEIQVVWYDGSSILASDTFYPDAADYHCAKTVEDYTRVVIRGIKTSKSHRPMMVQQVEFGRDEVYTSEHISSNETLSEISQLSEELTNNSLDFSLKGVTSDIRFQKQQELSVWFDGVQQGVFYIKTGARSSRIDYDVYAEDAISLLDETWYGYLLDNDGYHAWFNNDLGTVIYYILHDSGIPYYVEPSISSKNVEGYLPVCTRREALQQVAFAAGAIVDTFGSSTIRIVPRDETKDPIVVSDDYIMSLSVEDLDDVSKVVLTTHSFVLDYNNGNGQVELFNSQLPAGQNSVTFNEPCVVYSAENAAQSYFLNAINLAFVTPVDISQPVVLKGYKQVDNKTEISKLNPRFSEAKQNQNVIKIEDAYFVNTKNADEVLERVYQYYLKRKKVTAELVGVDVKPGDMLTLPLYDGTTYTGMVERVTSTYSSRAYREVVIR